MNNPSDFDHTAEREFESTCESAHESTSEPDSSLGCGRFSESDWSDLLTYEEPIRSSTGTHSDSDAPVEKALCKHMRTCPLCQEEWNAFAALTSHIEEAMQGERPNRDVFVEGVLAAVRHERQKDTGPRHRWMPRPLTLAAVLALFAVLGAGLWSSPWTSNPSSVAEIPTIPDSPDGPQIAVQVDIPGDSPPSQSPAATSRSTGREVDGVRPSDSIAQVLPGGAILRAVQDVATSGTARAGALRTDGVSAAATDFGTGDDLDVTTLAGKSDPVGPAESRPEQPQGLRPERIGDENRDWNENQARTIRITSGTHTATSGNTFDGE